MTRYEVQIQFGKTWIIKISFGRHTDALHHIKENSGERYKMRIVRVVKTVIFEEK